MDWLARVIDKQGGVEIALKGECDLYAAPSFGRFVLDGIDGGWRRIVLDCSDLSYLDSTGVGSLIRILRSVKCKNGELSCRGLHGAPRQVLAMSNILPLLREEKAEGETP
jgi:anti-sigma B factor antagonist